MPSVICVHFSQLVEHCDTNRHTRHNTMECTHAMILVSALNVKFQEVTFMVELLVISVT